MSYVYETCCINSTASAIHAMTDSARKVQYKTALKHCKGLLEWAKQMGYELTKRQGLTLKDDWAVSYHRSVYRGRKCYYVRHSAIEYIWTYRGAVGS